MDGQIAGWGERAAVVAAAAAMTLAVTLAGCAGLRPGGERTLRTTVGFDKAWTDDSVGLQVNAWSCNGDPEITVLEETADDVHVQITATIPAPGWGGDDCLDTVTVPLERPIGERTLTDLTSGKTVPVEVRQYG